MGQFFIVQRGTSTAQEWNPLMPDSTLPRDCLYFGKVLAALDGYLGTSNYRFYLTWDVESVPEYGEHVVVFLIGEEWGLIPRYARHVKLVAKVMSEVPSLGVRKWWPLNALTGLLLIKYLRNWCRHARSSLRYQFPPTAWPAPLHARAQIARIPWGSASLVDLPMKSMSERENNVFFSGEIAGGGAPKVYSRRALIRVMRKIVRRYPELSSDTSIRVHRAVGTSSLKDFDAYAKVMMNSKLCLAPRGTVADTWRYFEGLKSGCVVVTNPLPSEWYYQDAPVIQVDHWDELEDLIYPLLSNEGLLMDFHLRSIDYWNQVCGEDAVARHLVALLR